MNGKQLLRRYAAGERDFGGVDLKGTNLSGVSRSFDVDSYAEPCRQVITSKSNFEDISYSKLGILAFVTLL